MPPAVVRWNMDNIKNVWKQNLKLRKNNGNLHNKDKSKRKKDVNIYQRTDYEKWLNEKNEVERDTWKELSIAVGAKG